VRRFLTDKGSGKNSCKNLRKSPNKQCRDTQQ